MSLQPKKKSFSYYIQQWYEYALWEVCSNQSFYEILQKLNVIDDSILIIDDILDKSEKRNWNPSLYKEVWIEKAIITSQLLYSQSTSYLLELCKVCKTSPTNQLNIIKKFNQLLYQIYQGQDIDQQLPSLQTTQEKIKTYFQMITLFTGGHIKFWLEIWQLLANKEINKNISNVAEHLWIIRQIYDDFSDYFPSHHEIFWDFINGNSRIPEILFEEYWWDRNEALWYIHQWNTKKVQEIILNPIVRKKLFNYCQLETEKISDIYIENLDIASMIEDFSDILTQT